MSEQEDEINELHSCIDDLVNDMEDKKKQIVELKLALYTAHKVFAHESDERAKEKNQRDHLAFVFKGLYDDIAEYQKINKIGGYNNHWMKLARQALNLDQKSEDKTEGSK